MHMRYQQVSFLEYPKLIGAAKYGVLFSPEDFAQKENLIVEKSFDDLGEFSFLGLKAEGCLLALRRHTQSTKAYSYVSVLGVEENSSVKFISKVFDIDEGDVVTFDEYW